MYNPPMTVVLVFLQRYKRGPQHASIITVPSVRQVCISRASLCVCVCMLFSPCFRHDHQVCSFDFLKVARRLCSHHRRCPHSWQLIGPGLSVCQLAQWRYSPYAGLRVGEAQQSGPPSVVQGPAPMQGTPPHSPAKRIGTKSAPPASPSVVDSPVSPARAPGQALLRANSLGSSPGTLVESHAQVDPKKLLRLKVPRPSGKSTLLSACQVKEKNTWRWQIRARPCLSSTERKSPPASLLAFLDRYRESLHPDAAEMIQERASLIEENEAKFRQPQRHEPLPSEPELRQPEEGLAYSQLQDLVYADIPTCRVWSGRVNLNVVAVINRITTVAAAGHDVTVPPAAPQALMAASHQQIQEAQWTSTTT